jgi:hypothetical protein
MASELTAAAAARACTARLCLRQAHLVAAGIDGSS